MKDRGLHEGCIEQMVRLLAERLYGGDEIPLDAFGRIRLDDLEMRADVQAEVEERWSGISTDTVGRLADLDGYRRDFLQLFGFEMEGVDYEADVDAEVAW
jgi:enoyl-[acyl-carrier protein] reductase/trans-2-enoyl-CoA reductase (NAD+)